MYRAEVAKKTPTGERLAQLMKDGAIVPSEITVGLLRAAVEASPAEHLLVDGFPRNAENQAAWDAVVGNDVVTSGLLFFSCTEPVCLRRLLERGLASGRSDDNEASIAKRFATYHSETGPVVEGFRAAGLLVEVDAAPPQDTVYASLQAALSTGAAAVRCRPAFSFVQKCAIPSYLTALVVGDLKRVDIGASISFFTGRLLLSFRTYPAFPPLSSCFRP
jgi:adenylate kinase family enzyme